MHPHDVRVSKAMDRPCLLDEPVEAPAKTSRRSVDDAATRPPSARTATSNGKYSLIATGPSS
jgi:hypothetical protein